MIHNVWKDVMGCVKRETGKWCERQIAKPTFYVASDFSHIIRSTFGCHLSALKLPFEIWRPGHLQQWSSPLPNLIRGRSKEKEKISCQTEVKSRVGSSGVAQMSWWSKQNLLDFQFLQHKPPIMVCGNLHPLLPSSEGSQDSEFKHQLSYWSCLKKLMPGLRGARLLRLPPCFEMLQLMSFKHQSDLGPTSSKGNVSQSSAASSTASLRGSARVDSSQLSKCEEAGCQESEQPEECLKAARPYTHGENLQTLWTKCRERRQTLQAT
ncbi:hypothetical protein AV530_016598 [Patagioenas fasciata monilis]|uniref:Uncharacterized protein n=1 Tax=Patagioenas fasciata monilis TaxID=372326 RepID=A0A1V4J336_PATFA|nr:hypothetical protein AV530_016598 [Patagioenas fasciata monilis]